MKRFVRIFALGLGAYASCTGLGFAADKVRYDPNNTRFSSVYDFYIGGLRIAEIGFQGLVDPLEYTAKSSIETRGILSVLVGGRMVAESRGYRHTQGHLAPDYYENSYVGSRDSSVLKISYTAGEAEVTVTPPEPVKPYDTHPSLHDGMLDPITAAVTMITPRDPENLCNRTIPVFDGKRRFDIILLPRDKRPEGDIPTPPKWDKPVVQCFGVYERIAGFEADLTGPERYFPFDIWFEKTKESTVFPAIRIVGKTRLGHAIGTLRR